MRKKLLSLITVLCLIFPCFFVVACKTKETLSSKETYNYSIKLKNAKGLINEETLKSEYDYKKDENIDWNETGGSYEISATKLMSISGSFKLGLIEGYDYSNVELKINEQKADFDIKCGEKTGFESEATAIDRQLCFDYKNINSDTEIIIDFSNCVISKVEIDVTALREKGVKYYQVQDEFVTLNDIQDVTFNDISENKFIVDYGTVFAFDYSDQLSSRDSLSGDVQKLDYASYGIRYFTSEADSNRIQYITAKENCACEVYNVREDNANDGTLRVLSSGGIKFALSLEDLQSENYAETTTEEEIYFGENIKFTTFSGTTAYLELDDDAKAYNYYLVDELGKAWSSYNIDNDNYRKTIDEKTYLEIPLTDDNGDALKVKYLARKPRGSSTDYYVFYAENISTTTNIIEPDYIIIGNDNYSVDEVNDDVFYGYKKGKDISISIPGTSIDQQTSFVETIERFRVFVYGESSSYSETFEIDLLNDPKQILNISAYADGRGNCFKLSFVYDKKDFTKETFTLKTDNITLYDGEKVYYSTDLKNWSELVAGEELSGSTRESSLVYYYITTTRVDSYLLVERYSNTTRREVIGTTGLVCDCFGRAKQGTVKVGDVTIDLSRVMYLEIQPGYYTSGRPEANIVREYDKTYHSVEISSLDDDIMISFNGYKNVSYQSLKELGELKLRYEGFEIKNNIYYYVKGNRNKYLVLKNSKGEIVSTSDLVLSNSEEVKEEERYYVHQLSLNAGYYSENETFSIEVVNATYIIRAAGSSASVRIYKDSFHMSDDEVSRMELNRVYFILCEDGKTPVIYDKFGLNVIKNLIEIPDPNKDDPSSTKKLYQFTFQLDDESMYPPNAEFRIDLV